MGDSHVPQGRFGRIARMAAMSARAGTGALLGGSDGAASALAETLGSLRGLAAKVGQLASYVDGVVPEAQRESFERALGVLRAQAPRSPWPAVKARLEQELEAPLEARFASLDPQPLASASIGQVHAARLRDGTEVVVKVQHPGIEQALESDLANASMLEGLVSALGGRRYDPGALLQEVRTRFREELDYGLEAQRAHAFAAQHRGDPRIRVPRVFDALSTRRVLTSERVSGLSFEQACAESEADRRAWAETLWRFTFKSMLGGALLHADPHPGNYFFQPHGAVAFLDYGCVQELSLEHRLMVQRVHRCALAHDPAFDEVSKRLLGTRPGALEAPSIDYLRRCLQPLSAGAPYRITRAYAVDLVERMKALAQAVRRVPEHEVITMPSNMLFVNRLQFGLYSVLARLDVDVDYAAVERVLLSELDTTQPTQVQV